MADEKEEEEVEKILAFLRDAIDFYIRHLQADHAESQSWWPAGEEEKRSTIH